MSKAKFKKGDKVRILDGSKIADYTFDWYATGMSAYVGKIATIRDITKDKHGRTAYTVEEFEFKWDERGLAPAEADTIVIYRKGQEVIAYNKNTGKKATAKCGPDDDFNFEAGAKLAFRRLMSKTPKFKVGDRVIGNDKASKLYPITKKGWKGRVTHIISDSRLTVEGKGILLASVHYDVDADCFDLDTSPVYFNGKVVCIESNSPYTTKGKIYEIKDGHVDFDDGTSMTEDPVSSVDELNKHTISRFIEVVE